MKAVLFVVLCLSPVIFTKHTKDELHTHWDNVISKHKTDCIKESGVEDVFALELEKYLTFPDDQNFKCYVKCIQQNLNVVDSQGNFNAQTVEKLFIGAKKEMAHKCIQEVTNEKDICKIV
ncbi:hypothetical protein FQA39_LY18271 [Lamprigera yunnana]|nr:hypothetical protein FQA39_LY18271 [Lamprigera yunnana]